jgi:hypothetical protein
MMKLRTALFIACLIYGGGTVWAQSGNKVEDKSPKTGNSEEHSTGRTAAPEDKGQQQPQGRTGPLTTGTGGAPAESPQGQSPPDMQAAPEGSSKTVVEPGNKR